MQLHSYKLDTQPSIIHPGRDEAIIIPIGDIQLDPVARHHERTVDIKRLKNILQWGMDHNAYFTGMGDYVDVASPSNRTSYAMARFYDNLVKAMQESADRTEDELHDLLAATKGRWLGLLTGHHYWQYHDGTTTDSRLAEFLGTEHLGTTGFNLLRVGNYKQRKPAEVKMWSHHGQGGGGLLGASLNKLDKLKGDNPADIMLMGHYHTALAAKRPAFDMVGGQRGKDPTLVSKERVLAVTGSFLRGHMQNQKNTAGVPEGGYAEVGMMSPLALGSIAIFIRPRMTHNGFAVADLDHMSLSGF